MAYRSLRMSTSHFIGLKVLVVQQPFLTFWLRLTISILLPTQKINRSVIVTISENCQSQMRTQTANGCLCQSLQLHFIAIRSHTWDLGSSRALSFSNGCD